MTKDLVSAIQRIEFAQHSIDEQIANLKAEIDVRERAISLFLAERRGLVVAIEEMNKATPEDALPVKVPRLDIAKAVLGVLQDIGPHTLDDLARAVEREPSQVQAALDRLGSKVEFGGSYGGDQHRCYRVAGSAEQVAA